MFERTFVRPQWHKTTAVHFCCTKRPAWWRNSTFMIELLDAPLYVHTCKRSYINYLPNVFGLISRGNAAPTYRIFIRKHPFAIKRHTADDHIHHPCRFAISSSFLTSFMHWPFLVLFSPSSAAGEHVTIHSYYSTGVRNNYDILSHQNLRKRAQPPSTRLQLAVCRHMPDISYAFGVSKRVPNVTKLYPWTPGAMLIFDIATRNW